MSPAIWSDVSVPLTNGMLHWPTDPPVAITRVKDMAKGDSTNVSLLSMGAHTGTHVDAPVHFLPGAKGVDAIDFSALIGRARVLEISSLESITVQDLKSHRIRQGERILFKTTNSANLWHERPFMEDFVYLSDEAADYLLAQGAKLVGADYLSIGSYRHGGGVVHRRLLQGGVWIVEGLNLHGVAPGTYDMVCLPLRVVDGDGAPARCVLRSLGPRRGRTDSQEPHEGDERAG
jgi:arylformamidase